MHFDSKNARARRGGAAFTIAEECERLFCETLRTIFLGEGGMDLRDSLAMETALNSAFDQMSTTPGLAVQPATAKPAQYSQNSTLQYFGHQRLVTDWLEIYDYVGGSRFRGYIAEGVQSKSMFVFFDVGVLGNDLKPGLMALLELCNVPEVECSNLVVCVDRDWKAVDSKGLLRDLGWVGFEAITMTEWSNETNALSERWMLLSMEA